MEMSINYKEGFAEMTKAAKGLWHPAASGITDGSLSLQGAQLWGLLLLLGEAEAKLWLKMLLASANKRAGGSSVSQGEG